MLDLYFDISGETLPADYAFVLWKEALQILPWLGDDERCGFLPLKAPLESGIFWLPKRTKLVLRISREGSDGALALCERAMQISGTTIKFGSAKKRELQFHPTLNSHLVCGPDDETDFLSAVGRELAAMGIDCKLICGKSSHLGDDISGKSLVLFDLKPQQSLLIQEKGLGDYRRFGCGIFQPHKNITGLD